MSRQRSSSRQPAPSFDPTLSHGILAVILIIGALIIALSFFEKAGTVGIILNEYVLSFLFGSIRFVTPIILLVSAWYLITDREFSYRPVHLIGAGLFFLSLSSLLHISFPLESMWTESLEGNGGGVFGMLAWPVKMYLGSIAGILVLIGTAIVSVMLMFHATLDAFIHLQRNFLELLASIPHNIFAGMKGAFVKEPIQKQFQYDEDSYDDEDEEEEVPTRQFFSKKLGEKFKKSNKAVAEEEVDEDEAEEDEEDMEDEEPVRKPTQPVRARTPEKDTDEKEAEPLATPAWLQHVLIKPIPSLALLSNKKGKPTSGDIKSNAEIIQNTFKEFGIDVTMEDVRVGPTVTQYSMRPASGVKLSRITGLSNDLALALAAHPIRIEAPIPGKSLVGIEVPNEKTAMVSFRELLESQEFIARPHNMMIALGKDVAGKTWFADLPRMPHLLIAGATGSGKTVCVNTLIMSLLYQNTAETLRMIMVDPKRVELTLYNGIPHLLTPVITNTQQTVNALKWTIGEMERRFELLSQAGNRDIASFNKHASPKLPHIVFIIDELADLMATAPGDVEAGIIRLAQMARAVGIHLILATQRPSVDVITGLMKANIPGRIAFSVASLTDSRTILDTGGAEKLLGRGDMLLSTAELSKPVRIQGAYISEDEMKRVVQELTGGEKAIYDESIIAKNGGASAGTMNMFGGPTDDQDPLFEEAKNLIVDQGKASASFLQRRFKVGYARAARILDELEEAGIIGPADGAKPREILVTEREIGETTMDMGGEFNVYKHNRPQPVAELQHDDDLLEDEDKEEEDEHEEEQIDTPFDDMEDVEEEGNEETEEETTEKEPEEDDSTDSFEDRGGTVVEELSEESNDEEKIGNEEKNKKDTPKPKPNEPVHTFWH